MTALTRYRSAILADPQGGPQAYYRLNDRYGTLARDEQLFGYAGTCNGGITKGQAGAIANSPDAAMLFDGSSGFITLPAALNPAGWGLFSVECWVNLSNISFTSNPRIVANSFTQSDNNGVELLFTAHGASAVFHVGNGSTFASVSFGGTFTNGSWNYFVGTYDGALIKAYLNGALINSTALTGTISSSGHALAIGYNPAYSGDFAPALIDEVAIYNYALSASQISTRYTTARNNQSGPYTVWVSGKPVEAIAGSLLIDSAVGRRSTAQVKVRTSTAVHFQQDQQAYITDQNEALAFSGSISLPREQKPGFQPSLIHQLTLVDQHRLADKRVVAAQYSGKSATYIINDLVKNVLSQEGVTIAQLYDGPLPATTLYPATNLYPNGADSNPPSVLFGYATVAQALDALTAQTTTAGIPYYWQIDQNKQLWFVPYSAVVNNTVIDGTLIDQVNQPAYVTRSNPAYGNTQYIVGGIAQTAPQYKVIYGDGQTSSWPMDYDVYRVQSISLNGVAKQVGVKGIDTGKDFYYQPGAPDISQDTSGTKLKGGTTPDALYIWYTGQYPAIMSDQNAAQVAFEQSLDGTSGIVETVTRDTTVISFAQGVSLAAQRNTRYAAQGAQFQFTTRQTGLVQGQFATVNYGPHGLFSVQMLLEGVQAHDRIDQVNIWYTVNAVIGPYDTTWTAFFGKLFAQVGQPAQNISVGSLNALQVFVNFTGSITVAGTLTANVYACPLPSTTLFPSNSLFPC